MGLQESNERVEGRLELTRDRLVATGAKLTETDVSEPRQCTDDLNRPTGEYRLGYSFTAAYESADGAKQGLDAVETLWRSDGLDVDRSSFESLQEVAGFDGPRDFLAVRSGESNVLEISAGSGCGKR